jgi:hypothetical protein
MRNSTIPILMIIMLLFSLASQAQHEVKLELAAQYSEGKLSAGSRAISIEEEKGKRYLKFVGNALEQGVVWLPVEDFTKGKIELVARGMNVLQGSFVGIVFHAVNDSTYDYVYCRPFNFRTTDSLRNIHMIQYVHRPKFDWPYLRKNYNGQYENGITDPPEIEAWFKMTLIIDEESVKAYINNQLSPSLVVDKLNKNSSGKIGISGTGADVEWIRILYQQD